MCNMNRIGLTVSEEMSFENVDGRTPDACIYYKLTMSLRLRWANNNQGGGTKTCTINSRFWKLHYGLFCHSTSQLKNE